MSKGPVLVLGARSEMAKAIARRFAEAEYPIVLAARRAETLEGDRADMALRFGVEVSLAEFDALATESHASFVESLPLLPEIAVCAVGTMTDQTESETDSEAAIRMMRSNYEGPASIMSALATQFEARGSGTLIGISSVAGERGRATNYTYGSAKAGFTAFMSGLRNRLAKRGVHVVTVLPGFVDTQMTVELDLPEKLTAKPAEVGEAVYQAVAKKKNVIYVRPIWKFIMGIIRIIPEGIFKGMKI
ncbi:MAG: SDR family oxidoreductase [Pseudomonadota bacterium]